MHLWSKKLGVEPWLYFALTALFSLHTGKKNDQSIGFGGNSDKVKEIHWVRHLILYKDLLE